MNASTNVFLSGNAPARPLSDILAEVRFYKAQTVNNVIEIGRRLIEAKDQLQHGQWRDWLQNEVEFSHNTANRYMRISQEFASYSNNSKVVNLSYTKLLMLLAIPVEERENFIEASHEVSGEEKTVSDMSTRELERLIRERDEARRERDELKDWGTARDNEARTQSERALNAARERDELQRQLKERDSRPIEVAIREPGEEEIEEIRNKIRNEMMDLRVRRRAPLSIIEASTMFCTIIDGGMAALDAAASDSDPDSGISMLEAAIDYLRERISELLRQKNILQSVRRFENPDADDLNF